MSRFQDLILLLWNDLEQSPAIELVAIGLMITCFVLAARENPWCWPAAFTSFVLLSISYQHRLAYFEFGMNLGFAILSLYGWREWNSISNTRLGRSIILWKLSKHLLLFGSGLILAGATGFMISINTNNSLPYLDGFTSIFTLTSTWMLARKILESWLYWVTAHFAAVFLQLNRGFYFTTILLVIYIVMAIAGYFEWKKNLLKQNYQPEKR